jgi:hypothetical protein
MLSIVDALFGCAHRHSTFPRTSRKHGIPSTTYVVCLDCGKEFPYDWQQMRVMEPKKNKLRSVAQSAA